MPAARITPIIYNGVENYSNPSVKTVKVSILENNTINVDNTINVNNHTHNVTIPINITVPVVNEDDNVTVIPLNFTKDNITLVLKYLDGEQNVTVTLDPSQYDLTGENGTYVINFITDHFDNSELTIIYANG